MTHPLIDTYANGFKVGEIVCVETWDLMEMMTVVEVDPKGKPVKFKDKQGTLLYVTEIFGYFKKVS